MRPYTFEHCFYLLLERRYHLGPEESMQLARLRKGQAGESQLDASIMDTQLGSRLLRDLWLPSTRYTAPCQLDAVLVLDQQLIIVEAKHYSGHFRYAGCLSQLNQRPYTHDIRHQLSRQEAALRYSIQGNEASNLPIKGYVVFTDSTLHLEGIPRDFLSWQAWQQLLRQLAPAAPCTPPPLYTFLSGQQFQNPHRPRGLSPHERHDLTPGILCQHCHQPHIVASRYKICCSHCGHREDKSHAYLRTLCECAILYHDCPLTLALATEFFGADGHPLMLKRTLQQHTQCLGKGRNTQHRLPMPHLLWDRMRRERV